MARILENNSAKRIIKMSAEDIISIVREYQKIVPRGANSEDTYSYLQDCVIYIPED